MKIPSPILNRQSSVDAIAAPPPRARHSSLFIRPSSFRGFSLVEVLLAIFILGIGMIMVASVFPVGANWTRQTTEESTSQTIVQNALSVLRVHYGPGGDLRNHLYPDYYRVPFVDNTSFPPNRNPANINSVLQAPTPVNPLATPFTLQAFPGFTQISPLERAYLLGSSSPFPVPVNSFNAATYFWTAMIRLDPSYRIVSPATNNIQPSSSYKYDVYIMVFRKGSADQRFTNYAGTEIPGLRDSLYMPLLDESRIPSVGYATWMPGNYSNPNWTTRATPPIGQSGIGALSGTVFKQVINSAYNGAVPRPMIRSLPGPEPIVVSHPADATNDGVSPLIYIYQTSMSF